MRKSVLLISHELTRTGAPIMLLQAAKDLKAKGISVAVYTYICNEDGLKEDFVKEGIEVINIGISRSEPSELLLAYSKNYDLVIINTIVCTGAIKTFMDQNIPVLWWIHEGPSIIFSIKKELPEKLSSNFRVFCVSDYTRKYFLQIKLTEQEAIMGNCVGEDDYIDYIADHQEAKQANIKRFICVGTIEYRKGQDVILKAIERIHKKGISDLEFVFVGMISTDEIRKKLEQYSQRYPFIKVYSPMPRGKVLKLMSESSGVLVPSRDDPLPLVAEEAMMLNRPVIVSNQTGTASYIEPGVNGFIMENEDDSQLAEIILWIKDHPKEAKTIGKCGRKVYEEYFSQETFKANLYSNVMDMFVNNETVRKSFSNKIGRILTWGLGKSVDK